MQIDELPAGEQTQNPDLDMNQVVGTHDILSFALVPCVMMSARRKKRQEEHRY